MHNNYNKQAFTKLMTLKASLCSRAQSLTKLQWKVLQKSVLEWCVVDCLKRHYRMMAILRV